MKRRRIVIAYNEPVREQRGQGIDYVSEAGVLDQVRSVEAALLESGYEPVLSPVRRSIRSFADSIFGYRPDAVFNLVEGWCGESRCLPPVPGRGTGMT